MCCPEDWKCIHACEKREGKSVCSDCEIPVCAACSSELEKDGYSYQDFVSLPPSRSLRNELMVFYAPFENYLHDPPLTIMEMICCSVCVTSMICFSMEVKYGHMLDADMHGASHRVAARGNATTFMMPWQSILSELNKLEEEEKNAYLRIFPKRQRSWLQWCKFF